MDEVVTMPTPRQIRFPRDANEQSARQAKVNGVLIPVRVTARYMAVNGTNLIQSGG